MLVVSGLEAGKFLNVQLASIWTFTGGTGLTKPSNTPPGTCEQLNVDCACAGTAVSSNRAKGNSRIRILIQLPRGLALFVLPEVIYALAPTHQLISGPRQPPMWTEFRRSRRRGARGPLDRGLCVAIFRWLCPWQNRVGVNLIVSPAFP